MMNNEFSENLLNSSLFASQLNENNHLLNIGKLDNPQFSLTQALEMTILCVENLCGSMKDSIIQRKQLAFKLQIKSPGKDIFEEINHSNKISSIN